MRKYSLSYIFISDDEEPSTVSLRPLFLIPTLFPSRILSLILSSSFSLLYFHQ